MIAPNILRSISRARLLDAKVLLKAKRYDGAVYLCGYAVELVLKARICQTLRWAGFPDTQQEFKGFGSVKTHDLEILLRFSGIEPRIKKDYMAPWSVVLDWDPEKRYQRTGQATQQEAIDMISSATRLLRAI